MKRRPSFLEKFIYHVGECEVPREFFLWSGISLIATCLGDRVYYEKFRGTRLLPNMYVVLIGPSGLGKGVAIDAATKFLGEDTGHESPINVFRGKTTAPHIIDYIARQSKVNGGITNDQLYLITPELSMSVGSGPIADMFVKLMTELYTGGDYDFQEGTRTAGHRKMKVPIINWLAGSTKEWLVASVSKDAIEGGFFARIASVRADYDFTKIQLDPSYPPDYDDVMDWLYRRVRWMCRLEGKVTMSARAKHIESAWYHSRPVPDDELMLPVWKREHDMVLKLAMIMMTDERPDKLMIRERHIVRAQKVVKHIQSCIPELITLSSCTPESEAIQFIRRLIQASHIVDERTLVWLCANRGLTRERVQTVCNTLETAGDIECTTDDRSRSVYRWLRRSGVSPS